MGDCRSMDEMLESLEQVEIQETGLPSIGFMYENFKTHSAMIRYLFMNHTQDVSRISKFLGLKYRLVYGVIKKHKKEITELPQHTCPVCRNRKG